MVPVIMIVSIRGTKKSRGRPKTTGAGTQIGIRWHDELLAKIDAWAEAQIPPMTRPSAIRRLVELGLKVKR